MLYNVLINQLECVKKGLTDRHGAMIYLLSQLSSWADTAVVDGVVYYKLSYTKIQTELPLYFKSRDTVFKCIKTLREAGIVEQSKVGKTQVNYIRLTPNAHPFLRVGELAQPLQGWANLQQRVGEIAHPGNTPQTPVVIKEIKQGWANLQPDNNNNTIDHKQKEKKGVFIFKNNDDLKLFANTIAAYFGVVGEGRIIKIFGFLNTLSDLDYFKKQFKFYCQYKAVTGERIHRWANYQAEWADNDFELLLNKFNKPTQAAPIPGYRRHISI